MVHIPESVLKNQKEVKGLLMMHRGKVRDSYLLSEHPEFMLVVVSDRISTFDQVLNGLIKKKGEVLNAMSYYWTEMVIKSACKTDFTATGTAIDEFLPANLRKNPELQKRASIVRKINTPEFEDIVRFILTGSALESYNKTGMVCGNKLPADLHNGSLLPWPIYTPTTKAITGHDEPVDFNFVRKKCGIERETVAIKIAGLISRELEMRDIALADIKFEFGYDESGTIILVDEKATPDSSRFLDMETWFQAAGKKIFPPSMDKQFVREWAKKFGIDKLNPENTDDIKRVDSLPIPEEILKETTAIYLNVFKKITGMSLEKFQRSEMGIL
jgi:phosphoribosylaminoimidazole-succinocarboxamide synthase